MRPFICPIMLKCHKACFGFCKSIVCMLLYRKGNLKFMIPITCSITLTCHNSNSRKDFNLMIFLAHRLHLDAWVSCFANTGLHSYDWVSTKCIAHYYLKFRCISIQKVRSTNTLHLCWVPQWQRSVTPIVAVRSTYCEMPMRLNHQCIGTLFLFY